MSELTMERNRLKYFPIPLFATVMGLAGLSIALIKYDHIMHVNLGIGKYVLFFVSGWFLFLLSIYGLKLLKYPLEVREEFNNPVRVNFFPAVSISLLLLSIGYLEINPVLSKYLWYIGTCVHALFTFTILHRWIFSELKIAAYNPAWFIPVVGTILVPVAGSTHSHIDISWFFFSIGFVMWIVLYSMMQYRIMFHHEVASKFLPTYFIFIAPPAIGFISYMKMTGSFDSFARILYFFGLFTFVMLATMIKKFIKLPYFVSWWAYTFPLAAITISTLLMYTINKNIFYKYLSTGLLCVTLIVDIIVIIATIKSAVRGNICIPE